MPDRRRARCRNCRRHRREVGELSWSGLCGDCGDELLVQNVRQLAAHEGPNFERWRRNVALSVGGLLLDDIEAALQTGEH